MPTPYTPIEFITFERQIDCLNIYGEPATRSILVDTYIAFDVVELADSPVYLPSLSDANNGDIFDYHMDFDDFDNIPF